MLRPIIKVIYRFFRMLNYTKWHLRGWFYSYLFEYCDKPCPRIGPRCIINGTKHIRCGKAVYIGHDCFLDGKGGITLEDYSTCSCGVKIMTGGMLISEEGNVVRQHVRKPVRIGKKAWLGVDVKIMAGVTIGENVVVGAGAVVTRDLPPNGIYAGVPAKLVRELKPEE